MFKLGRKASLAAVTSKPACSNWISELIISGLFLRTSSGEPKIGLGGNPGKISADILELGYLPIIISRFLDASERAFFLFKSSAYLDSTSDLAKRRSLL